MKALLEGNHVSCPENVGRWSLELITTDKAESLLVNRANNRRISGHRVDHYESMMRNGQWMITHQGICLNKYGCLNDGQHRLQAIVNCGIPQWMWVYREACDATGMRHFDQNQPRNTSQILTIAGLEASKLLVSVARAILADGVFTKQRRMSAEEEVWKCIELNRSKIDGVLAALGAHQGFGGAAFIAVIVRAWHCWPGSVDKILRFVQVVGTGVTASQLESSAIRYRDWTLSNDYLGTKGREQVYYRCVSALTAFVNDRPLSKLYVADSDPFKGCGIPQ